MCFLAAPGAVACRPRILYRGSSFSARMAFFRAFTTIGPPDHGKEASLAGWVEDVRNLGGIAFLIVRQRGGTFQVTAKKKADEALFNHASKLVRESVVAVRGTVQLNPQVRNGWELVATSLDVLSPAAAPLPLPIADKVGAEVDTRFDNRVLDLRKPERRPSSTCAPSSPPRFVRTSTVRDSLRSIRRNWRARAPKGGRPCSRRITSGGRRS